MAVAVLAFCGWSVSAAADTAAELATAAASVIRDLDLQAELPEDAADLPLTWWQRFLDWLDSLLSFRADMPPELIWLVVVFGLALLLYACRDILPVWRMRGGDGWGGAEGDAGATGGEIAGEMATADELARQGRIVEAMHWLLLHALAELRRRLDRPFADSLTSREILRGTRLPEEGRGALREIIARVEWSYFGGHPAEPGDYEACRQHFGELARILRGEAGA